MGMMLAACQAGVAAQVLRGCGRDVGDSVRGVLAILLAFGW